MRDYKKIRFNPSYLQREELLQNKQKRRFKDPSITDKDIAELFYFYEEEVYFSYIA
jgi:hypothetical protein